MLIEALVYLVTPCPFDYRRLGYLSASIGLWSRAARCRKHWSEHYARCHGVVREALAGLPHRRRCVVLGSGLIHDVPLAELAAGFDEVLLVDVIHLWPARLAARRFSNVRLVSADLTGTADLLLGRATGFADPLLRFRQDPSVDLVISANALSQLPMLPSAWFDSHPRLSRYSHPDLEKRIILNHLDGLRRFGCRVCLLTDTEMLTVGRAGALEERLDLLHGVELPAASRSWQWTVAPLGEDSSEHSLVHLARGYPDFHAAEAASRSPSRRPAASELPTGQRSG